MDGLCATAVVVFRFRLSALRTVRGVTDSWGDLFGKLGLKTDAFCCIWLPVRKRDEKAWKSPSAPGEHTSWNTVCWMFTCVCVNIQYSVRLHMCVCKRVHVSLLFQYFSARRHVYMYVCMNMSLYTYVCRFSCAWRLACVCVCAYVCVCLFVCVCRNHRRLGFTLDLLAVCLSAVTQSRGVNIDRSGCGVHLWS